MSFDDGFSRAYGILDPERAVLGAILLAPAAIEDVKPTLEESDFSDERHCRIYRAILDLSQSQSAIDLVTVKNHLSSNGGLEKAGGTAYLSALVDGVPDVGNVEHYARIVREKSGRRRLARVGERIAREALSQEKSSDEIAAEAEDEIRRTRDAISSSAPAGQTWFSPADVVGRLAKEGDPIPTNFARLDRFFRRGGIIRGKVVVIGGPPGAGKTTFAKMIACSARIPVSALFFDEGDEPAAVMIGQGFGFDRAKLEIGDPETVAAFRQKLADRDFRLIETESPDATVERAVKVALEINAPVRMVVLDSVQTIKLTRDQEADPEEREAISAFMWKARHYAKKHGLIMVIVAQLSRTSYKSKKDSQDLNPLAMFAGSRAIEHASDVAILLETPNEDDSTRLIIARNRLGEKGSFHVRLDRKSSTLIYIDPAVAADAEEVRQDEDRARRISAAEKKILKALKDHPGAGKNFLRRLGNHGDIDAAIEELGRKRKIRVERTGQTHGHFLVPDPEEEAESESSG